MSAVIHYPPVNFRVNERKHQRYEDLEQDVAKWLTKTHGFEDAVQIRRYVQISNFTSRFYAHIEWSEKLVWVNRLMVVWIMIDDVGEEEKLFKIDEARDITRNLLDSIKNPERKYYNRLVKAHQEILANIRLLSPESWYSVFVTYAYQWIYFHYKTVFRDSLKLDVAHIELERSIGGGAFGLFDLFEFLTGKYLSDSIRSNPLFNSLRALGAKIIGNYNDYISFEKEYKAGNKLSMVFVLQRKNGISYQDAIYQLKEIIEEDIAALWDYSPDCVSLCNEKDQKTVQLYLDGIINGVRANRDYMHEVDRYPHGVNEVPMFPDTSVN